MLYIKDVRKENNMNIIIESLLNNQLIYAVDGEMKAQRY